MKGAYGDYRQCQEIQLLNFKIFCSRFNMPHNPLTKLKPREFPKIGDEENAFNSYDEDTDEEAGEVQVSDQIEVNERTPLLPRVNS